MAKVVYIPPIKHVQGSLEPDSKYYHRVLNGKDIIQRKPRKPASEAQANMRKRFAERWAGRH